MTPLVVVLIATAAVAHATWNIALKKSGASGTGVLWLAFLVSTVVFAPFGIVALAESGAGLWHWVGFAAVSGVLQVAYFLLLQYAYRVGDVSVVYPLARGSGPLLSVVLAVALLHEHPSLLSLVGAGVLIVGVMIIGFAGDGRANRAGVLFGLLVGVAIAAYTLWDSNAVLGGRMPPVGLYFGAVIVQAVLLAPAALRERALTTTARRHWPVIVLVGVLSPLAYILVLLAIQQAPVSIVAPAREVSVVLVGLAGWLLFREPHPRQRLIGAAVVLLGVALLAT